MTVSAPLLSVQLQLSQAAALPQAGALSEHQEKI